MTPKFCPLPLDFVHQRAAFGFGRHGDDIAVHVHFSAVIEAE